MRRLVQILMILYYPFLGVVCLAAGALGWFFVSLGAQIGGRFGLLMMAPGLFFGLTLVQIVWSARALLHPVPPNTGEIEFPPPVLAGLSKLTRRIASEQKLPAPDIIRLVPDDVAYVYEDRERRKILVIGAMALSILSQSQLASVIAHELGHFAGGDTRLSRIAYRWRLMMAALDHEFDQSPWAALNPLAWLIRGYHLLFRWAWSASSRSAEFAADRRSVEHAGRREAALTAILLHALDKLPWARLDAVAGAAVQLNVPVDSVFAEQVRRAGKITAADWQEACARALRTRTGAFDSHPALRDRLRAIGVSRKKAVQLSGELSQAGPRARGLIADWNSIEQWLSALLIEQHREIWEAKREVAAIVMGRHV
jgi:Zn-dependent protease with chaperone function